MSGGIHVVEGDLLAAKYRIERVLGRGGMGMVVAARHLQLDERVAIKLMLPDTAQNAEAVSRFMREARAAAKIKSEHVVRVSDVGMLGDGQPYMVMEYLDGSDLAALLAARGRLPIGEAVEYVVQVLDAIGEAHALGIVHRDLKPSNLFVTRGRDGSSVVKVLDFGISKLSGPLARDEAVTRTSALLGSPLYMSPEQLVSSRDVDARSDIWALGVILFELLAGVRPFQAPTLPQACSLILQGSLPSLRDHVADIPDPLAAVVERCLTREPSARFQNVHELAAALAPFTPDRSRALVERISLVLAATGSTPPRPSSLAPTVDVHGPKTDAPWGRTARSLRARRASVVAIGAALTLGLAGVIAVGVALRGGTGIDPVANEGPSTHLAGGNPSPLPPAEGAARPTAVAAPEEPPAVLPIVPPSVTAAASASAAGVAAPAAAPPRPVSVPARATPVRRASPAPRASEPHPADTPSGSKKPDIFRDRK